MWPAGTHQSATDAPKVYHRPMTAPSRGTGRPVGGGGGGHQRRWMTLSTMMTAPIDDDDRPYRR